MKRLALLGFVLLTLNSCFFKGSSGASGNLTSFATRGDKITYEAIYNFGITGQLAGGISTRLEIAQTPMAVLRRLDTTTKPQTGNPITVSSWYVTNPSGHFSCAEYGGTTKCTQDHLSSTTFGDQQVDGFFDLPRRADAFGSVRRQTRPIRIKGEQGTCFEAAPPTATSAPAASPQASVPSDRYDYTLCYSDDGILLRGRRTDLTSAESGATSQDYVLEVVSITRVVQPADLRLPGPIVSPDVLKP